MDRSAGSNPAGADNHLPNLPLHHLRTNHLEYLRPVQPNRLCPVLLLRHRIKYPTIHQAQCFCKTGYFLNNADSSKLYCDRCFIGCATCSGPLITNCLTCAANFTLDSSLGTCTAPMTTSDLTILRAYYFYGFNALGGWSPTTITNCGFTTLLGTTTSATPITFSTGTLKSHF